MRFPGPLGSCPPVCALGVLLCRCRVLGHLAPVQRCARLVCCFTCALSWATWLLFTGVLAPCVVFRVRFPGPLGSCSPVCSLGVLCRVCGVLGHLAPVHRCARSVRGVACAGSWATWLMFTRVLAGRVVLRVPCPRPLGSCSPVCPLGALRCVCAVSWATWLLFTAVPAGCVVSRVWCPGPRGSCSPVCTLGMLCCCAVSWATALLFIGLPARCVALRVCGVLGHQAPFPRYARSVCCVVCAESWATWRLFTGVLAQCVLLRVRCPGPLGSCPLVCSLGALCCVCGVLCHLAPVQRCAGLVCCVVVRCPGPLGSCSPGVLLLCVVLRAWCSGPLGSCSPVCSLTLLCCVCGVVGLLAPVQRCARSKCCAVCCVCRALGLLAPVHRCARRVCCVACVGRRCGVRTRLS